MCGKIGISILTTYLIFLAAGMSVAATEEEKHLAVEASLSYLASTQDTDGSWPADLLTDRLARTGSSVLAFLQAKGDWGNNAQAYQDVIDKGLNYILGNASIVAISVQSAGNPDGDGNGIGVKLYPGARNDSDIYVTGVCLPAIAVSGRPDKVVSIGPLAGRIDGTGTGGAWTYRDVVQNVIDYFAYGQNDGLYPNERFRGGWRYYANYGQSDQSSTQFPVISGVFASLMEVFYPQFVLDELAIWTSYIQNLSYGYAGYMYPTLPHGEMGDTGALLTMQSLLGQSPGDAGVDAALNYIKKYWQSYADFYEDGNFGQPYAMWAIYNGLGLMIGLDDEETITDLRPDPGGIDNANHGYNWWEDYCEFLVRNQNGNGSWNGYYYNGYYYWDPGLATPWYTFILATKTDSEPSEIEVSVDIKPAACPNMLNVASKGKVAVAIAGSDELDVTTINPFTIRLAAAMPIHYSYDDVTSPYNPMTGKVDAYACTEEGPDGYPDMILTFDIGEIVAAIGEVEDGDLNILSLTGNLKEESGGTDILGEDVLLILKKDKGKK